MKKSEFVASTICFVCSECNELLFNDDVNFSIRSENELEALVHCQNCGKNSIVELNGFVTKQK